MDAPLTTGEVEDLYARYGFFLLRRCRTLLRDPALADDALQETFVKVLRMGAKVRDADEPLRWLYRVVDHTCFDALRRRRRAPEPSEDLDARPSAHPGIDVETRDAVLQLLGTLDESEMRIALGLFVDGLSQREIADDIGLSRVTVNKKIQAIRARADRLLGRSEERNPS